MAVSSGGSGRQGQCLPTFRRRRVPRSSRQVATLGCPEFDICCLCMTYVVGDRRKMVN